MLFNASTAFDLNLGINLSAVIPDGGGSLLLRIVIIVFTSISWRVKMEIIGPLIGSNEMITFAFSKSYVFPIVFLNHLCNNGTAIHHFSKEGLCSHGINE